MIDSAHFPFDESMLPTFLVCLPSHTEKKMDIKEAEEKYTIPAQGNYC